MPTRATATGLWRARQSDREKTSSFKAGLRRSPFQRPCIARCAPGAGEERSEMKRDRAVVADDGVRACEHGDRTCAMELVRELIAAADFEDAAAQSACRLYE